MNKKYKNFTGAETIKHITLVQFLTSKAVLPQKKKEKQTKKITALFKKPTTYCGFHHRFWDSTVYIFNSIFSLYPFTSRKIYVYPS